MAVKILVSAGEASGDMYASELVRTLRARRSDLDFFGTTGPKLRAEGVRTVVDAHSLSVVGLVEVLGHIPRIYGEFRKLLRAARQERPQLAILTDSPDFHLRMARKLRQLGIPVVYLVAPQVWAWRQGRVRQMRHDLKRLLCLFPFEEAWFRQRGVPAEYIGHPLSRIVRASCSKQEFFRKHELDQRRPVVALLAGSRLGEVKRHLAALSQAARLLQSQFQAQNVLALPRGFSSRTPPQFFRELEGNNAIQFVEGDTYNVLAHCDVALAASGTVTIEAAMLGAPMVTFYKVTALSWTLGRMLVKIPFYSMVNLVAGERIVPELMQDDATGSRLAGSAALLLADENRRREMRKSLQKVSASLRTEQDPMVRAAEIVEEYLV